MPDQSIFVGRPTVWGNPFRVGVYGTASERVEAYRESVRHGLWVHPYHRADSYLPLGEVRAQLRGFHLVCWCRLDQPCHAEVLLEIANA